MQIAEIVDDDVGLGQRIRRMGAGERHDHRPGRFTRGDSGRRILDDNTGRGINAESTCGQQISFRVGLALAHILRGHEDRRKPQTSTTHPGGHESARSGRDNGPGVIGDRGQDGSGPRDRVNQLSMEKFKVSHLPQD